MEAKSVIRTVAALVLTGCAGLIAEKVVWQTADAYPGFLAGHRVVGFPEQANTFAASDARTVCGLTNSDDVYENADVAFKLNGTFIRCRNHLISRVYRIEYGNFSDKTK